ncbi:acyltransferase [Aquihabitans sp. G128]|uniref:acyltransferase family protein n=1 Tax=Aquihabitans sp. G128 TaxID=2849779 RepID=UPI001C23286C|nr:acyltransferase [Aquihabitans sp. G128]QXC60391.1 acyltransferase [Aquihabitans sp. G128]
MAVSTTMDAPAPETTGRAPRFQAMNGLRLLSAVLIVVFHAASSGGGTGLDRDGGIGPLFSLFDLGVPIFFVLSGFLLYRPMVSARLAGTPRKSIGRYAWHRFRRIFPAYWAVLFIAAWRGQAELGTGWQPWRIAALLQVYDSVAIAFGLGLVVAWSLCTEVSFYAYLPIHNLVMRFSKGLPGKRVLDEWIACGVLGAIAVGYKLWLYSGQHVIGFAVLFRFTDAFAVGMALAVLSVAEGQRRQPGRLFALLRNLGALPWAAAAGLILVTSWYRFPPFPEPVSMMEGTGRDLVKVLIAALLVMPLVVDQHGTTPLGKALSTPVLRWWGELTYGIFLIHLPLMSWIQHEHLLLTPELLPTLWLAVISLAASSALAAVLYFVIERPLQHLDPFRGGGRRKRAGAVDADGAPVDDGANATLAAGANG